jgi:hypothetical protein
VDIELSYHSSLALFCGLNRLGERGALRSLAALLTDETTFGHGSSFDGFTIVNDPAIGMLTFCGVLLLSGCADLFGFFGLC